MFEHLKIAPNMYISAIRRQVLRVGVFANAELKKYKISYKGSCVLVWLRSKKTGCSTLLQKFRSQ